MVMVTCLPHLVRILTVRVTRATPVDLIVSRDASSDVPFGICLIQVAYRLQRCSEPKYR